MDSSFRTPSPFRVKSLAWLNSIGPDPLTSGSPRNYVLFISLFAIPALSVIAVTHFLSNTALLVRAVIYGLLVYQFAVIYSVRKKRDAWAIATYPLVMLAAIICSAMLRENWQVAARYIPTVVFFGGVLAPKRGAWVYLLLVCTAITALYMYHLPAGWISTEAGDYYTSGLVFSLIIFLIVVVYQNTMYLQWQTQRDLEKKQASLEAEIEQRIEIERVLKNERDYIQAITENMAEGLSVTNLETTIYEYVNQAYADITLTTPERIVGTSIYELITSNEGRDKLLEQREARLRGEKSTYINQLNLPTGEQREIRVTAAPLSIDGKITHTVSVVSDITDQIAAQRIIQRRDAILSAVGFAAEQFLLSPKWTDCIDDVLQQLGVAAKTDNVTVFAQKHLETSEVYKLSAQWSCSPEHTITQQTIEITPKLLNAWGMRLQNREAVLVDKEHHANATEQAFLQALNVQSTVMLPLFISDKYWGVLGFSNTNSDLGLDASEIEALRIASVALSAAIERMLNQEALFQVQKMESIGVLAGGIAHDFNNLLMVIGTQSQLALRKLAEDHKAVRHIEKADVATKRAARLTKQMLAYAGKGSVETTLINLTELVEENIQLFRPTLPAHVTLNWNTSKHPALMNGDATQIAQVVMNLIINASESMDTHATGKMVVSISHEEISTLTADTFINAVVPKSEQCICLRISDTGKGMDTGTLNKIFEPFFTTKPTGHGLGLAATLGIIKAHGGGIRILTALGQGTTQWVYFPVLETRAKHGML